VYVGLIWTAQQQTFGGYLDENKEVRTRIKVKVPKWAQNTFNNQQGLEEVMIFFWISFFCEKAGVLTGIPIRVRAGTKNSHPVGFLQ
jgi:hypothetical protein